MTARTRLVIKRNGYNNVGRLIVFVLLGTVVCLNLQPWLAFSRDIISEIEVIPLLDVLIQLPFVGGVITWLTPWFYQLIAISLWVLIQTAQCGTGLIKLLNIKDSWWVAQISRWSKPELKALAYCAEITLTFLRYPPYIGGWDRLMDAMPQPDMNMIDWTAMGKAVLVIFAFELFVHLFNQQPEHGPKRARSLR